MDEKDTGFLLDLACYSIIEENNAGQYYPDYAYEHALFYTWYEDIYRLKSIRFSAWIKAGTVGWIPEQLE